MATETLTAPTAPKHTALTRLAHAALGIAIITQLATSQFMVIEEPGSVANGAFWVHEYSGLAAFSFMLLFWVVLSIRHHGTERGLLFPWFSGTRLTALWGDIRDHVAHALKIRLPPYHPHSPVAAAIHGLGLIIITLMAASGTLYYFVNAGDPDAGGLVKVAMTVHLTMANLAWAYLIAHASIAVLYHFATDMSLREMWSVDGNPSSKG